MAEETTVTPGAEAIAPTTTETAPEGSVASIEAPAPVAPVVEPKKEETVPLSVYLALKDDMKDLKQQLKERPQSQAEQNATIKAFVEKYPDTNPEAIADLVRIFAAEVDAKYSPIIEGQKAKEQQQEFDRQFDIIFEKAKAENPDAKHVNKDVIKALALTPQYNNTPVADIIKQVYPSGEGGRATTENDMRPSGDAVETIVDIDKITPEQRARIMDDPVARKKYFDALDAQGK